MALTLRQRPRGSVLNSTPLSATITDSSGSALVNYNSHGLSNGDTVFITSDYSHYNGFWQIVTSGANAFFITKFVGNTVVEYVVNATVSFYKSDSYHYFNSLHLPIEYNFTNDLWPVNFVDNIVTVNSYSNDNGYVRLTLSGDVKTTGSAQTLEFLKITVDGVESVYQIINWFSDTSMTIDLEYSGYTFGNVQYYYSNYSVNFRLVAGIIDGQFNTFIGSETITEFQAVPDENNVIKINVNEYLKTCVNVLSNRPDLVTMPMDTDAFCQFYIEYAESYDQSLDGYTLGTYESSFTSDTSINAIAVNSNLPFKNRYSGFMSEYLGVRKFLTLMSNPVLFVGNYFDIAFLNEELGLLELRQQRYLNGALQATDYTTVADYGSGLYRMEIVQDATEDRIDVSLVFRNFPAFSSWVNYGTGVDWSSGSSTVTDSAPSTKELAVPFYWQSGVVYTFTYQITLTVSGGGYSSTDFTIGEDNATSGTANHTDSDNYATSGVKNGTFTITPTSTYLGYLRLSQTVNILGSPASSQMVINSFSVSPNSDNLVSEIKTITVDSECSNQDLYLTWKNYLGGHDYWKFTAEKEYGVDISDVQETTKNINTNWPNSFGEFADTIKQDISRTSNNTILVRSQNLTLDQVNGLKYIKTSPLVQIMTSKTDRRTVQVDSGSFVVYSESDKLYGIQFTVTYTDNIPSQGL